MSEQEEIPTEQIEHIDSQNEPVEMPETSDNEEPFVETRYKRVVRKPKWMRDYISVFSICREMPETKTTPRKRAACPNCKKDIKVEDYLKHVKTCGRANQVEPTKPAKTIPCNVCNTLFSKNTYLNRHKKKFRPISATSTSAPSDNDSQVASSETQEEYFDEWDRDPEIELDYSEGESSEEEELSEASSDTAETAEDKNRELTLGRIERKRTSPGPVKAPIKRKETETVVC